MAVQYVAVPLLRQIPSIGPIRAALLVALIQTAHRFRTKRQFWSYIGLAPKTYTIDRSRPPGIAQYMRQSIDTAASGVVGICFRSESRHGLRARTMNHTDVEWRPFFRGDGQLHFVLPKATASAVIVIGSAVATRIGKTLEAALAGEYSETLCGSRVPGTRLGKRIVFEKLESGHFASMVTEVDAGISLHVMFAVDGIDGFSTDGLDGMNANAEEISDITACFRPGQRSVQRGQIAFLVSAACSLRALRTRAGALSSNPRWFSSARWFFD